MIATTFLAYVAESDAKAINSAGSLRMATYRINYLLANHYQNSEKLDNTLQTNPNTPIYQQLTDDMDKKLGELAHYQTLINNHNPSINDELVQLTALWQTTLKPALLADNEQAFFQHSMAYINFADQFVHHLQTRNEERQAFLRSLQVSVLLIILVMMIFGMYEVYTNVLTPINQLVSETKRFSKGEKVQVHIAGYEEFQGLGKSFNEMANTIYDYQQDLQNKVAQKTADLTQANDALRLLYDFANQVNREPLSIPKLYGLIHQFSEIIPNIKLSLCIHGEQTPKTNRISVTNINGKDSLSVHSLHTHLSFTPMVVNANHLETVPSKICQPDDCNHCELKEEPQTYIIPIHSQGTEWGELLVQDFNQAGQNFAKHEEILYTLANLIAIVFNNQKQRQQADQLILEEERKTIARELHDSLAQSLTYLKMKLAILGQANLRCQDLLCEKPTCKPATIDELKLEQEKYHSNLIEAREGLDRAYRQLRELLVTFRLSIEEGDFDRALSQACEEFAEKGGFKVQLNNRVLSLNLTANEQVHLLHIIREVLSNAWRHAHANTVSVDLYQHQNTQGKQLMYLVIEDDGVGLNPNFDQRNHHGLNIIAERTRHLNGDFQLANADKGVRIEISFLPKFFNQTQQVA